ncbi:MAG: glycosyltransferase family 2 protein [Chloroflexota bacterium]
MNDYREGGLTTPLPTVTFVAVTANSLRSIAATLETLVRQDYPADLVEIVVVDNASTDGTPDWIQAHYPQVKLIRSDSNPGFATANNIGAQHSQSDYLALVNPDVTLANDWLSQMVGMFATPDAASGRPDPYTTALGVGARPASTAETIKDQPLNTVGGEVIAQQTLQIGVAGCKIFFGDGITLNTTGGILRPNGITKHRGAFQLDTGQYETMDDIDYANGAAMFIRRDVWTQLGGFDPHYFLYFEEVDFCQQVRRSGYRVMYNPRAIACHHEKFSTSGRYGMSLRFLYWYHGSRYRFMWKTYAPTRSYWRFAIAELAYIVTLLTGWQANSTMATSTEATPLP